MPVSLTRFTDAATGVEVHVNPVHVTLVKPRNGGTCLRLLGETYTIEVRENVATVVAALQGQPYLPEPHEVDEDYERMRADLVRNAI